MSGAKQPVLGIIATIVIIVVSLLFIAAFDWVTFSGWVSTVLMCAIPFSLVVGVFWKGEQPKPFADWGQPQRGIVYLLLAGLAAALVAVVHWVTAGGSASPPIPMFVMTIITSVVVTFFLTIVWGGWPFTLIPSKFWGGMALLVGAYVINALVFRLFNFGFAEGAPFYRPELDPQGPFNAWDVVVFLVTALAVMFVLLHFDLWPLTKSKGLMKQPVLGIVFTLVCLVIGGVIFYVGTRTIGIDPPIFLVAAPIPYIFGSVILLNMLQGSAFEKLAPPLRGLVSAIAAAVLGVVLTILYRALMPLLTEALPSGAQGYEAELWAANALLAVTFPFLAFYGDFFQLWPLARKAEASEVAPEAA